MTTNTGSVICTSHHRWWRHSYPKFFRYGSSAFVTRPVVTKLLLCEVQRFTMIKRLIQTVNNHPNTSCVWLGLYGYSRRFSSMMPTISVNPKIGRADQPVCIQVSKLPPLTPFTVRSHLIGEKGHKFEAHGHYTASTDGEVHLDKHPSIGGTYTGIEPMGLFWSMVQSPGQMTGIRYVKLDVTQPSRIDLSLYPGYLGIDELQDTTPVTTTSIERVFMDEHMERFEVKAGRVRGMIIKPKGRGPFPGIIDLYGTAGGLMEMRASLLANYGYAVLALAFCGYQDLPEMFLQIDLDYFEESINWFTDQDFVMPGGIGTIGLSKGGEIAVAMATYFPEKVKAVVSINGAHMHTYSAMKFRGQTLPYTGYETTKLIVKDGNASCLELVDDPVEQAVFDFSRVKAEMLWIAAGDDLNWKSQFYAEEAVKILKTLNMSNYQYLYYPEAGHLIEPSNTPFCALSYHKLLGLNLLWGGKAKAHTRAQEDSWKRILQFFQKKLQLSSKI
ncbi:acyl-coenzyme A thioesterase 1-like [Saccoglossus kowalevskii]|uniref:Acyl-coenzyme A thioesterase 1-like n=1 Tax=Saccoglossus kowalevskii TaxID=10224 RepID=A0ABM0GQR9_SACKO|nr:PREDICTED: acyl-coenzyme A thioesterase 1-like [Saccoglossus kowalevskii]